MACNETACNCAFNGTGEMADKRDIRRHRKRIKIRFGIDEPVRMAFTEDISMSGMFIKTPSVMPPNTKIRIELLIQEECKVELEARVMWAKKVPPNLFHLAKKGGMGVRFLRFHAGEEHFNSYFDELSLEPVRQ